MNRKIVDWTVIRSEWTTGKIVNGQLRYPTHEELSKKYDLNVKVIQKKSSDEEWGTERLLYKERFNRERKQNYDEYKFKITTRKDLSHVNTLDRVQNLIEKKLSQVEENEEEVNIKELETIVRIVRMKDEIMKDIFDEPRNNKENLEKRKLEQKEELAEKENQDTEFLKKEISALMKDIKQLEESEEALDLKNITTVEVESVSN